MSGLHMYTGVSIINSCMVALIIIFVHVWGGLGHNYVQVYHYINYSCWLHNNLFQYCVSYNTATYNVLIAISMQIFCWEPAARA